MTFPSRRISTCIIPRLSSYHCSAFTDKDPPNHDCRKQGLLRHMRHKQDSLANRTLLPTICTSARNLYRINLACVSLCTPSTHSLPYSFAFLSSAVHLRPVYAWQELQKSGVWHNRRDDCAYLPPCTIRPPTQNVDTEIHAGLLTPPNGIDLAERHTVDGPATSQPRGHRAKPRNLTRLPSQHLATSTQPVGIYHTGN